jgi:ethanolamine utilization protein EutN
VATLGGQALRLVELLDAHTLQPGGKIHVAADVTGSGDSELVLLASGASARKAGDLQRAPVDLVIIAIVDELAGATGTSYRAQRKDGAS